MIIQCILCRTKYRFDETLLGFEGAWVRCSRCQNVFFQHPPLSTIRAVPDQGAVSGGEKGLAPTMVAEGRETPPSAGVDASFREEIDTTGMSAREEDAPLRERMTIPASLSAPPQDAREEGPAAPSGGAKKIRVWVLGLIMLILAATGGAMFVFPEYGQMVMGELNVLFPGLGLRTTPEAPAAVGPAQVRIADVRQRFVANPLLGNIRVVEGLAMNTSSYPMTRIKIRGELYDLVGALVKDNASFCGNILSDEELAIMSEEQIFRELAIPQGSDVPNDRINPQGTIPFMLVFVREPNGVDKTMVTPIAAERLLSP